MQLAHLRYLFAHEPGESGIEAVRSGGGAARRKVGEQHITSWKAKAALRLSRLWSHMPPKSRFYVRASSYRSERAAIVRWFILCVATLALLGGLGYLFGRRQGTPKGKTAFESFGTPFRELCTALTAPGVALVAATALLVLLAWSFRRAWLAVLVWRGSKILVRDFIATGRPKGSSAAEVTAIFRQRLAALRLASASPAPGAAPESTFVDVLSGGGASDGNFLQTFFQLLRAAIPTYAIEAQGFLRERAEEPRCGISIQIAQGSGEAATPIEVWGRSWLTAAEDAADEATAAILPRSRLCRGPWAAWQGFAMPLKLLGHYERASELEQQRRFDEAMRQYWDALRLDPTNLTVRLQLGQLQEKAGLFLAALTNYLRIIVLGRPGGKDLPRGLYRRAARREWDRALLLAKYRAIVLLGEGSMVGRWSNVGGMRRVERIGYRRRLHEEFRALLEPLAEMCMDGGDPVGRAVSAGTLALIGAGEEISDRQAAELRKLILEKAQAAARDLVATVPRRSLRPRKQPLTRRTLALTGVCMMQREPASVGETMTERLHTLEGSVHRAGPWPRRRRWHWHEHYNAACAYALALDGLVQRGAGGRVEECARRTLVSRAITHLERAVAARDYEFVSAWRDWILSEDPDLEALRSEARFRAFEAMYFPAKGPFKGTRPSRPWDIARLTESRYTRELLCALAMCWHDAWHERAYDDVRLDGHSLARWGAEEIRVWEWLRQVASDVYDWRTRQELLVGVNALLPEEAAVKVSFGLYEDMPIDDPDEHADPGQAAHRIEDRARKERERSDERLMQLATVLNTDRSARNRFARWTASMRSYDCQGDDSRDPALYRDVCHAHAAVWQSVASALEAQADGDHNEANPYKSFDRAVKNAIGAWARATDSTRYRYAQRCLHALSLDHIRRGG